MKVSKTKLSVDLASLGMVTECQPSTVAVEVGAVVVGAVVVVAIKVVAVVVAVTFVVVE